MTSTNLLLHLTGTNIPNLSKSENSLLQLDIFVRICNELRNNYKLRYKEYFRIMKLNTEMENAMLETNFIRHIINNILSTEEYTLSGVAYYTHSSEDVIFEIASGKNIDPSASLLSKIIELHRSVRPTLYSHMLNKILSENTGDTHKRR